MDTGWVKFTGDYAELKNMGFEFQKLYGNNYMQWSKNGFRVWKRGHDITHDSYNLYKLISFLRTEPIAKKYKDDGSIVIFKFYDKEDKYKGYTYEPWTDENLQLWRDSSNAWAEWIKYKEEKEPQHISTEYIKQDFFDQWDEFKKLGWCELVPTNEEDVS